MNMRKIILPLFAVAVLVLMSGCIKVNIYHTLYADGMSDIRYTIEPINKSAVNDTGQDPCESILNMSDEDESESKMTDITCNWDRTRKILTITGRGDFKNSPGLKITGTRYRVDIAKALQMGNESTTTTDMMSPEDKAELQEWKRQGYEYYYYLKMPGTVVGQSGGETQLDGSIKFDMAELPPGAYVESDTGLGGLLGGLGGGEETPEEGQTEEETLSGEEGSQSSCCCCAPILPAALALGFSILLGIPYVLTKR